MKKEQVEDDVQKFSFKIVQLLENYMMESKNPSSQVVATAIVSMINVLTLVVMESTPLTDDQIVKKISDNVSGFLKQRRG